MRKEQVDKMISGVVREVMLSIFGKKGFEGVMRVMREKYNLDIDEVSNKPHIFSEALHEIIGVGSVIIEDLIIENLYMRAGLEILWKKGYKFSDYINDVKSYISLNPRKVLE